MGQRQSIQKTIRLSPELWLLAEQAMLHGKFGSLNDFVRTCIRAYIVETGTIDAVSGTDGLDVTSFALGEAFPDGVLVVQDDLNINPRSTQNFKLVSWRTIADALGLEVITR